MAKKTPEMEKQPVYKRVDEMTDDEFIIGMEQYGAPMYFDYMFAPRKEDGVTNGYLDSTKIAALVRNTKFRVPEPKPQVLAPQTCDLDGKKYVKKRGFALILIALVALALLAMVMIGYIGLEPINGYVNLFENVNGDVPVIDPVISMVANLMGKDMDVNFLVYFTDVSSEYELIPVYAIACAVILFAVSVLIMFVKALFATFEGKSTCGYYKKRGFGFLSVVALLCGVVCLVGGLYASGNDIMGIVDFVLGKGNFTAGYGLYAMVLAPIVTLVLSCVSYKKKKAK